MNLAEVEMPIHEGQQLAQTCYSLQHIRNDRC